jgi:hypothetical protein
MKMMVIILNLKLMEKTHKIDIVAMINARINMYQKADANDPFYQGAIAALSSLSNELQMSIDADVAAMESNTGE